MASIISSTSPANAWVLASKHIIEHGVWVGEIQEVLNLVIEINGFEKDLAFDKAFREIMGDDRIDFAKSVTFIEPKKIKVNSVDPEEDGEKWEYTALPKDEKKDSYFGRLINDAGGYNQIEHAIKKLKGGENIKTCQMTIYLPKDLRNPYSMPCMTGINCIPRDGKLYLTGVLRSNAVSKSGYADYTALCEMGQFIAKESGLELGQVSCVLHTAHLRKQDKEYKKTLALLKRLEENG